jgi:hypothetical protein
MTGASPASASVPDRSYGPALRVVAALGAVLVALIVAALLWARGYEPLGWRDGAFGADTRGGKVVHPVSASGKSAYFVRYRKQATFTASFTVTNTGRFDVEVVGLPAQEIPSALFPTRLGVLNRCCHPADGVSRVDERHPLRIPAGGEKTLHVRYGMGGCVGGTPRDPTKGIQSGTDRIRLRYRYLRFFERAAVVEMPMELVLSCRKGIDPSVG